MTLIAGYIINSCPVIVGDVLLSSLRSPGTSISLPSWHTDSETPVNDNLQIVGMVQKVNIINEQVCLAWAGSHLQAKVFSRSLTEHMAVYGLDDKAMLTFLHNIDPLDRSDLQCILHTVDNGILKRYHLNASEYECDGLMVQTGGSGVGHFLDSIQFFFKPPAITDCRAITIVGPGLSYIASAFGEQIFTAGGLSDGWGGAFELAFYANSKFQKLDDVLYLFWTATEKSDSSVSLKPFPNIIKTKYIGKTFVVYVNDNSNNTPNTRMYNICPLGKNDNDKHDINLSYTYLVNYIFFEKLDGNKISITRVQTNDGVSGFTIEQHDQNIHLDFSDEFISDLCAEAFGEDQVAYLRS